MKHKRKHQFGDHRLAEAASVLWEVNDGSSANRGNREWLTVTANYFHDIADAVFYRIYATFGAKKQRRKLKNLLREWVQSVPLIASITVLKRRALIADWRGREIATELI